MTINSIYKLFFRKRRNFKERYGENSWALVTGATDGIGKAFSFELASEGFNIILVSRTLSKLNKVSEEIKAKFPKTETLCVQFDFHKKNDPKEYLETFGELQSSYDISLLVNNVGTDHNDGFDELSLDDVSSEVILNICPQAYMTKILWKKLKERNFADPEKVKRSGIVNVCSFVADFPFPMKAVYAGTKAFAHFLSVGLENELVGSNVDFLSLKPLEVATPLTGTDADGYFIISPQVCAASAINDLSFDSESYGHWAHKIQAWVINLLPKSFVYWFMRKYWYLIVPKTSAQVDQTKKQN